jgi:hypothetical protein
MEMSDQLHAAINLPPEKVPPVPIFQEAEWTPEPVWTLWSKENPFAFPGIQPRPSSP